MDPALPPATQPPHKAGKAHPMLPVTPATIISTALTAIALIVAPIAPAAVITVPGATGPPIPGITNWDNNRNPEIGSHYYHDQEGVTPAVINYPRNPLILNPSLQDGQTKLDAAIKDAPDGKIYVTGLSMGTLVINREKTALLDDPDAPPADQLEFIELGNPERGIFTWLPEGTHIPLINYTIRRPVESQYNTTVVTGEYDGWADPPDRPLNLLADINAIAGAKYVHSNTAFTDLADVPAGNVTKDPPNSRGGVTTHVLVPTKQLPITRPLRDLGMPDKNVDRIDKALRPIIDSAYDRDNKTDQQKKPAKIRHHKPGANHPLKKLVKKIKEATGAHDKH